MNALNLSAAGLRFLKAHEGYRSRLYNDARGFATIGYGHLVHRGPVGTDPAAEARYADGIGEPMAAVLLAKDAGLACIAVNHHVTVPLTQPQFDALVSFAYNVGTAAFASSTLLRRVNTVATPDAIKDAFEMWDRAGPNVAAGLLRRRRDEAALFNEGAYGGALP